MVYQNKYAQPLFILHVDQDTQIYIFYFLNLSNLSHVLKDGFGAEKY
jgi:hypothetical protein